ncbi:MAG: VOC family protein [Peptococcaceae bacterium]|nr:VOC family protein [Peptococcaceae bacterium]
MTFRMVHNNLNVADLSASLAFYERALDLREVRRMTGAGFTIVFIGNDESAHLLELTCLADHPQKYDLGENEIHLAFRTDDFDLARQRHQEMGCICFENYAMGIYFIEDPDGYWLEILPPGRGSR